MVMKELEQVLATVTFGDMAQIITKEMCEIIVNGKKVDYIFRPSHDSPGSYTARVPGGEYLVVNGNDLTEQLLVRGGLLEKTDYVDGDSVPQVILRPTQKAMRFYEGLRQAKFLDENGLLKT